MPSPIPKAQFPEAGVIGTVRSVPKYDFIDALRGLAILGVILVHATQYVVPESAALRALVPNGARGVQLFYIASALTLCMSWEFRRAHEASAVRNFYLRRVFRIAPMFYVAILFYVWLYGFSPRYWAPNGVEWWFVALTAAFLHGFHPETITSVVPGGWSIAVEMTFYAILPILVTKLKTTRSRVFFLVFTLALYAISRTLFTWALSPAYPANQQYLVREFCYLNFFGQLPVFSIGLLTYFVFNAQETVRRRALVIGGAAVMLVGLIAVLSGFSSLLGNHIFSGFVFAVFALALARYRFQIFVNPVVTALGRWSFSMYLTHFAVLEVASRAGIVSLIPQEDVASLLFYIAVVVVTAFISLVFYKFVERRGVALGEKIITRLEDSSLSRGTRDLA